MAPQILPAGFPGGIFRKEVSVEAILALPGACKITFGSLLGAPGVLLGSLGALLRLMLASRGPLCEGCSAAWANINEKT